MEIGGRLCEVDVGRGRQTTAIINNTNKKKRSVSEKFFKNLSEGIP